MVPTIIVPYLAFPNIIIGIVYYNNIIYKCRQTIFFGLVIKEIVINRLFTIILFSIEYKFGKDYTPINS